MKGLPLPGSAAHCMERTEAPRPGPREIVGMWCRDALPPPGHGLLQHLEACQVQPGRPSGGDVRPAVWAAAALCAACAAAAAFLLSLCCRQASATCTTAF